VIICIIIRVDFRVDFVRGMIDVRIVGLFVRSFWGFGILIGLIFGWFVFIGVV
jgi:hypothetical protein